MVLNEVIAILSSFFHAIKKKKMLLKSNCVILPRELGFGLKAVQGHFCGFGHPRVPG